MIEQLTFDFDALVASEPGQYTGRAPLGFTVDFFTPEEFEESWSEQVRLAGSYPWKRARHGWHTSAWQGLTNSETVGHSLYIVGTDLRCDCSRPYLVSDFPGCYCPGDLMSQAICTECRWHDIGSERDVVAAWHDHAWSGWRDLPVLPLGSHNGMKWSKSALALLDEVQPEAFRQPGAPVLTERRGYGSRAVEFRSPFGGYDISSTDAGHPLKTFPPSRQTST